MSTSDILYTRASRSGVARPRLGTDSPDSGYSGLLQSTPTTSSVRGGTKRPSYASNSHLDDVIASSALYARSSHFRQSSRRPVKNARRDSALEHQASTFLAQDMGWVHFTTIYQDNQVRNHVWRVNVARNIARLVNSNFDRSVRLIVDSESLIAYNFLSCGSMGSRQ